MYASWEIYPGSLPPYFHLTIKSSNPENSENFKAKIVHIHI